MSVQCLEETVMELKEVIHLLKHWVTETGSWISSFSIVQRLCNLG